MLAPPRLQDIKAGGESDEELEALLAAAGATGAAAAAAPTQGAATDRPASSTAAAAEKLEVRVWGFEERLRVLQSVRMPHGQCQCQVQAGVCEV